MAEGHADSKGMPFGPLSAHTGRVINMKQRALPALTILLLLAIGVRLTVLIRGELRRLGNAREYASSVFNNGDLSGVGPTGSVGRSVTNSKYRLLFVVHKANLSRDVEYWNAARRMIGPLASEIEWWGICDSGRSCDAVQPAAEFSIVGFMPAYQMRIMANADGRATALLYEGISLRGKIERDSDPARVAEEVSRLGQQAK